MVPNTLNVREKRKNEDLIDAIETSAQHLYLRREHILITSPFNINVKTCL